MSDAWRSSFAQFYADMGPKPSPLHELDRIDNDGPYSAANCRWATPHTQTRNYSRNVILEHGGERMTMTDWAARVGLRPDTLKMRLYSGWSVERALTTPVQQ